MLCCVAETFTLLFLFGFKFIPFVCFSCVGVSVTSLSNEYSLNKDI